MKEIASMSLPSSMTEAPDRDGGKAKNAIGKDDFMKLLLVQLQNQDPLKPMEHQEFSAQLAQFGSLEQLTNIGKGIEKLHGGMGEEQKLQALNMIGRRVTASGNEVNLVEGSPVQLNYQVPLNVTAQKAFVYDGEGKVVRELPIEGRGAETSLVWDGKSQEGVKLPSGKYTFRVAGVDQNGTPQEASAELSGTVTGVELEGKNAMLVLKTNSGQTRLELNKVRQVAMDQPAQPSLPFGMNNLQGAKPSQAPTPPKVIPIAQAMKEATETEESDADESSEGFGGEDRGFRVGDSLTSSRGMEIFRR